VAIEMKPGLKLFSAVCTTEVVVVRAAPGSLDLRCGGEPLAIEATSPQPGAAPATGFDAGTLLGKRYADDEVTLELLCTKAGAGSLAIGDTVLEVKGAKPLPSSD
jgi:hypothetical protein